MYTGIILDFFFAITARFTDWATLFFIQIQIIYEQIKIYGQ